LNKIRLLALIGLALLVLGTFADFFVRNSSRMLMTFYTVVDGRDLIEERIVKNIEDGDMSAKVRRYAEEMLFGPLSHGAASFFPSETVQSCVVSGETAYIGLPPSAVLAGVKDSQDVLTVDAVRAIGLFKEDIKRNFQRIKNVAIFIDGRETASELPQTEQ
jgi:hypothetical protein